MLFTESLNSVLLFYQSPGKVLHADSWGKLTLFLSRTHILCVGPIFPDVSLEKTSPL